MKVLHLNAGAETGGGMIHILSLLDQLNREEFILGVFEEGEMSKRAREKGIQVEVFQQTSRYDLSILKRIIDYIKLNSIDIVHTHGPRANLYAVLLKPFTSCKWVTTIHSDPRDDFLNGGFKGTVFTKLNFFSYKRMDHFFAISNRFKDMLVEFGIKENSITTIYNGISFTEPKFERVTREELGLTKNDFVIIMIARLHPVKGHTIAFEAVKELKRDHPNVRLVLVGDGPIRQELEQKTAELGIENEVKFLGHKENIHGLLLNADAEILVSFSESFPLVILEAARAHVPVISTDVGGVKDLISDHSLGRVIPSNDVQALVWALKEYMSLQESNQLHEIAEKLYEKASTKYSIENFSQSVYNAYKTIL
ncbi:glycosyltransferase family 4 protein [Bacillus sp. JJ1566]|uniref:glycosyltransferase family 4 protein n=1 Tax=Bacillus sp. JJ1566 TaxID=3122961 RepID=UPI003000ECA7